MVEGLLYIAHGSKYVEAAVGSARSVRRVTPGMPIAIATDGPAPAEFDEAIPIDEPDGYRAKIVGMLNSPFDRTLMLDVDTYAAADLSEVFQVLDQFDVAAAHASKRVSLRVSLPLDDVPESFPELNTGVIAFRKNEPVRRLLQAWLEEYDRLAWLDQPAFRRVVYKATDVRLAVLPPEFNLGFWKAGYYNQRVRILHGWASGETYERVAAALNEPVTSRRYRGVFISGALFNKQAEVVDRFPEKVRRWRSKLKQAES
jgi:Nucleotide-diphospho-sugar transferase